MFGRIATALGVVAILAAIALHVGPRLHTDSGPLDTDGLTAEAFLRARARPDRPAPARARISEADRVAWEAIRNVESHDLEASIARVRADLEEHGESTARRAALAWLLGRDHRMAESKEELDRALELGDATPVAALALGPTLLGFARFPDAERVLRRAIAARESVAELHRLLAVSLLGQGRVEEARVEAERALALGMNDPACCLTLGDVHLRASRFRDALGWYEAAEVVAGPDAAMLQAQAPVLAAIRTRLRAP